MCQLLVLIEYWSQPVLLCLDVWWIGSIRKFEDLLDAQASAADEIKVSLDVDFPS